MGQKQAAFDSTGKIVAFYDTVDSAAPDGVTVLDITEAQWQACLSQPGYTVANGALVAPAAPTAAQLLAQARATQSAVLSAACSAAIVAGFPSSALGSACTYPSQPNDQTNLIGAVTASQSPGLPSTWTCNFWCADSTGAWALRSHTAAQIQQVLADAVVAREAFCAKLAGLVGQVDGATTLAEVQAIAWS